MAKAKLTIDKMIDPRIDIADSIKQIDSMAAGVKSRLPADASSRDKLEALRAYLYDAGAWNGGRPFRYDMDDPFGRNLRNKLLPTYLATRKGNCVSMPLLFIILGKKIGIDVTASTAPEHIFVKYRDDSGNLYNLEATSGAGFTSDTWIKKQTDGTIYKTTDRVHVVINPDGSVETFGGSGAGQSAHPFTGGMSQGGARQRYFNWKHPDWPEPTGRGPSACQKKQQSQCGP